MYVPDFMYYSKHRSPYNSPNNKKKKTALRYFGIEDRNFKINLSFTKIL